MSDQALSGINELLAEINAEKREFAQTIWPPASEDAVARLRRLAREMLSVELSEGYVTFLERHDGLDFNGFVIYGATEHQEPFLSGFVEANERRGGPQASYVYYGDTGDRLFAQNRTSQVWDILDRSSLDVVASFPSFEAMLTEVLRSAVAE